MKKFFTTLIILIIIAGLGFFFGWAQFRVPADSFGVIRSKTHGLDTRLVQHSEFRWIWYKLIPTNVTVAVFRLNPVNHAFSAHNMLPSGNVYAAFAGITGDFSWEINAQISFSLRPEALIPLVAAHNIGTQDELTYYENDLAEQIETFILRGVQSGGEFTRQIEALLRDGENPELVQRIQGEFPLIEHFTIRIRSAQSPDFELYRRTKELYEAFIALQKELIADNMRETAQNRLEAFQRLSELEQYGHLLTRYPILLEFLMFEKGNH